MESVAANKRHSNLKGSYIIIGALYVVIGIHEVHEDPFLGACSVALGLVYIYEGIS